MLFRQYLDREPVIAVSYLFGCPTKGIGAVVDPIGDIGRYLGEAEEGNVPIRYVIDTHMHADHISSGRELAAAAGAEYVLFAGTETSFSFKGVEDGEVLHMGNTEVEVLHTPGHTPEHVSLVVTDHARAGEPWLVLTGHTLMVSDMGRTELAVSAEEGARALFESAEKLRSLPDHIGISLGRSPVLCAGAGSVGTRVRPSASNADTTARSRSRTRTSSSSSCWRRSPSRRSTPRAYGRPTSDSSLLECEVTAGSIRHR